jgi:pilus assembly protein CpaB
MRFGTVLMFAIAFVCAAAAALLIRSVLLAPPAAPAIAAAKPAGMPTRTILVAARDLMPGEKLTPAAVREASWPAELLPRGVFTSREALFKGGAEPTLHAAIAGNEPILAQRLLQGPDLGLTGRLNDGMRGITIRVNEASGVGGFVQPEDRVDVLLTQTGRMGDTARGAARSYTKTLVRSVRVLATDQQTERRPRAQPPKTVTLEVSEENAKRLTLAGSVGQLSLTLNKGDVRGGHGRPVDLRDIAAAEEHSGEDDAADGPVVSVFRTVERKDYRVPQQYSGTFRDAAWALRFGAASSR